MKKILLAVTLLFALTRGYTQTYPLRYSVFIDSIGIQHTSTIPTKKIAITGDLNDALVKFTTLASSGISDVYTQTQTNALYAPVTGSAAYTSNARILTINGVSYDLTTDRSWTISTTGAVPSVFGRTGVVGATNGDYTTAQVTESGNLYWTTARGDARYPLLSGSYINPSWITSIPYSKITATPITLSGYGITDGITPTSLSTTLSGYATTASLSSYVTNTSLTTQLSGYASLTGSYSNPTWLTSLAWSKISGTPTTLAGYGITDAMSNTPLSINNSSASANITITSANFANGKQAVLYLSCNDSGGSFTVTLPSVSTFSGYIVRVIKTNNSANIVTIAGATGDNLIASQYQYREFVSNSTTWNNN